MWVEFDRICIAAPEREPVVGLWRSQLGAEPVGEDTLPCWAAERTTLRVGRSEVEILQPAGVGLVARHLARLGTGIVAVGFAARDLGLLRERLDAAGTAYATHGDQLFVASDRGIDLPGTHMVFSSSRVRSRAGPVERLFGATYLHRDHKAAGETLVSLLDLPVAPTSVTSRAHATSATIVRLDARRPDHLAFAAPSDPRSGIGRFFHRHGPRFWLASAHVPDLAELERRLDHGPSLVRSEGTAFLHPSALDGVLLHATDDPARDLDPATLLRTVPPSGVHGRDR